MKIWYGFGSEHSMNLVMIGHFKSPEDAKGIQEIIERYSEGLKDKIEVGTPVEHFSDEVLELLRGDNINTLGPSELEQFLYDFSIQVKENKVILTTEEADVSAFFKLMITKGAKVEIFSAHDYPDSDYGRGK